MTNCPLTGEFNVTAVFKQTGKYWKTFHKGIDLVPNDDQHIYSTCDGVVRVVADDPDGWGNYVTVGDYFDRIHIFCHLSKIYVSPGQKVTRSTKLGVVGKTGNATGVHLHYQLENTYKDLLDPALYIGISNKLGVYHSEDLRLKPFKDFDKVSPYAQNAVLWACEKGIIKGDERGCFNPLDKITRQDLILILYRMGVK